MITKILIVIKAATRHLCPQNQFSSRFVQQEFAFVHGKSKSFLADSGY